MVLAIVAQEIVHPRWQAAAAAPGLKEIRVADTLKSTYTLSRVCALRDS